MFDFPVMSVHNLGVLMFPGLPQGSSQPGDRAIPGSSQAIRQNLRHFQEGYTNRWNSAGPPARILTAAMVLKKLLTSGCCAHCDKLMDFLWILFYI